MNDVILEGCRPEPLMSYLKSLGVLRLVAEQADKDARGCWREDLFVLQVTLDRAQLEDFFLHHYCPTPIVAPWNAGCGLYLKWDPARFRFKSRKAVDCIARIDNSTTDRLREYRSSIDSIRQALLRVGSVVDLKALTEGKNKKESQKILNSLLVFQRGGNTYCVNKQQKDEFLLALRSAILDDKCVSWLDAALVLTTGRKKNRLEAPIFGSGGNIGNRDFSEMFARSIGMMLPLRQNQPASLECSDLLRAALFGDAAAGLKQLPIGQFDPGKAGGANADQSEEGAPLLNPWNYILMLEGALLMAGSASRRLGATQSHASFPFTVASSGVGHGTDGNDTTRGELWLPLWRSPCSIAELRHLLSEGRVQLGRRHARTGVDFARAIARLGVDRGIKGFVRYEFQERRGQEYLATLLGSFEVRERREENLLRPLDAWLDLFRRACNGKTAPARFSSALRRLDSAIFQFCRHGGTRRFGEILCALGNIERELALLAGKVGEKSINPVPLLSPEWVGACDDGSAEFRIAMAVASIRGEGEVCPLRANLEPVERRKGRLAWADTNRAMVWSGEELSRNLASVLERRVWDARRSGLSSLPLASSATAPLGDIATFLADDTDDQRIKELLWGAILIRQHKASRRKRLPFHYAHVLPRSYALLKLLFLPGHLSLRSPDGRPLRAESQLLGRLRAGDTNTACELAARRLRASGYVPIPGPTSGCLQRGPEFDESLRTERLAAALLIPIHDAYSIQGMVLRPSPQMTQ